MVIEYGNFALVLLGAAVAGIYATDKKMARSMPRYFNNRPENILYKKNVGRFPHVSMKSSEIEYSNKFF